MTALIADYYRHLTVDLRRSDHTVRAYVATAERLCGFLSTHWGEAVDGPALSRVTAADLRAFLAARRGEGLTAASTARELSAVRTFLHWTGVEPPPLKGPRRKRSLPRPQSPADIMALGEDMPRMPPRHGSRHATGRSCCCCTAQGCASARRWR